MGKLFNCQDCGAPIIKVSNKKRCDNCAAEHIRKYNLQFYHNHKKPKQIIRDRVCQCGVIFQPKNKIQISCSAHCRARFYMRKKYLENQEHRKYALKKSKEWKLKNPERWKENKRNYANRHHDEIKLRRRKAKTLGKCEICQAHFIKWSIRSRYCSPKCRSRGNYIRNKEQIDFRTNQYKAKYPDKIKQYKTISQDRNRVKIKIRGRQIRVELHDQYIKKRLKDQGLPPLPELINLKRNTIKLKRLINEYNTKVPETQVFRRDRANA